MTATATTPTDLIGLAEAAALLPSRKPGRKLHVVTLYRWIERGKLQGWRIGGHLFVSRAEVLAIPEPMPVLPEVASRGQRLREMAAAEERVKKRQRGG